MKHPIQNKHTVTLTKSAVTLTKHAVTLTKSAVTLTKSAVTLNSFQGPCATAYHERIGQRRNDAHEC